MSSMDAVRAECLSKAFDGLKAVDSVSFDVKPGEIFGLVGPDGAGKTTTIRMLCAIMEPTGGTAVVAGYDIRTQPEEVKLRIGYMSQRFSLYGELTVAENLTFFADIYRVSKDEKARRREELLEFSRLTPFVDRLAQDLSGGMRQKVGVGLHPHAYPTSSAIGRSLHRCRPAHAAISGNSLIPLSPRA